MDFAFGEPQTLSEFLLVAALEVLLLSFGILLALRINNWNEARKESRQTDELLGLLIQDLRENLDEIVTDIGIGEGFIGMCETVIQQKDAIDQVDDEDIDNLLGYWPQTTSSSPNLLHLHVLKRRTSGRSSPRN